MAVRAALRPGVVNGHEEIEGGDADDEPLPQRSEEMAKRIELIKQKYRRAAARRVSYSCPRSSSRSPLPPTPPHRS
jgi:hypothetical protein